MFRLFKKKIRWVVLIAAVASITSAQEAKNLPNPLLKEFNHIAASAPSSHKEKTDSQYKILDLLLKNAEKRVLDRQYDSAIAELRLIKKFCDSAGLKVELGSYSRHIIMCFIDEANHFRKKGDYDSATKAYLKARDAASIGEPRWVNKITHIIESVGSSASLAMK